MRRNKERYGYDGAQSELQVEGRNKEATEVKEIKVAWCENFIKAAFAKIYFESGGIETNGCWIEWRSL